VRPDETGRIIKPFGYTQRLLGKMLGHLHLGSIQMVELQAAERHEPPGVMVGRASRLIGSGSLAAQSLITPSQTGAAQRAGGVILSWLGNTHGCCHGEAEANDETTNQVIPQSPRERTSVTVHAVLSGRRAVFVRREPRGPALFDSPLGRYLEPSS
jgi:hypothetical protein